MGDERKPSKLKKALVMVGIAIAALVVVVAVGGWALVHKRIETRGAVTAGVAPDFTLRDQKGSDVSLASLSANGPAVLVFYRGFW